MRFRLWWRALSREIVTYDLSRLWGLYTFIWEEWVNITFRNEVRHVVLWISDWIIYTSCGLWKNLLYVLLLHLSGEYLCIMTSHNHSSIPQMFPDFSVMLVWDFRMVNKKATGFGVAKWVGRDTSTRKQIIRTGVSESDACYEGKKQDWWGSDEVGCWRVEWIRLGIGAEVCKSHWSGSLNSQWSSKLEVLEAWGGRQCGWAGGWGGGEEKATKSKR